MTLTELLVADLDIPRGEDLHLPATGTAGAEQVQVQVQGMCKGRLVQVMAGVSSRLEQRYPDVDPPPPAPAQSVICGTGETGEIDPTSHGTADYCAPAWLATASVRCPL